MTICHDNLSVIYTTKFCTVFENTKYRVKCCENIRKRRRKSAKKGPVVLKKVGFTGKKKKNK